MSKSIQLTQGQIKAYENGATMFIVPIVTKGMKMSEIGLKKDLLQFAPIQKGDKDIQIQGTGDFSPYTISECIDVRVDRVQDMKIKDWAKILNQHNPTQSYYMEAKAINHYHKGLEEANTNRTYNDNDYVFLIEYSK